MRAWSEVTLFGETGPRMVNEYFSRNTILIFPLQYKLKFTIKLKDILIDSSLRLKHLIFHALHVIPVSLSNVT